MGKRRNKNKTDRENFTIFSSGSPKAGIFFFLSAEDEICTRHFTFICSILVIVDSGSLKFGRCSECWLCRLFNFLNLFKRLAMLTLLYVDDHMGLFFFLIPEIVIQVYWGIQLFWKRYPSRACSLSCCLVNSSFIEI